MNDDLAALVLAGLPTDEQLARVHRELDELLRGRVTARGWRHRGNRH